MYEKAIEKLDREYKSGNYDKYAKVMKAGTLAAVKEFCRQDPEFAQAVVQGGSFENCMKAVAKNCGSGISDLEAYQRAVQFYFPTAEVKFQMRIDLVPHDASNDEAPAEQSKDKAVVISLEDFF